MFLISLSQLRDGCCSMSILLQYLCFCMQNVWLAVPVAMEWHPRVWMENDSKDVESLTAQSDNKEKPSHTGDRPITSSDNTCRNVWCKISFWRNTEQPEIQIAHRSFNSPNNLYFCRLRGQKQTSCWLSAHNRFWKHLRLASAFYPLHSTSSHYFKMRPEQLYSKKKKSCYIVYRKIILLMIFLILLNSKLKFFSVSIEITASC